MAAIFVPSPGIEDIITYTEALTKFTQQALNDSNQATSLLNSVISMMRKVFLQNLMAFGILTASQGVTCAKKIHAECCVFIPDEYSNVTHLMTHIKNQISALNDPLPSLRKY